MIEPPKLFTDARREYDMQEVELLGKFAIDCQLQYRRDIRLAFERLLEVTGLPQFHQDFRLLYEYVMKCHQERRISYTLSTLNRDEPGSVVDHSANGGHPQNNHQQHYHQNNNGSTGQNLSILYFTSYGAAAMTGNGASSKQFHPQAPSAGKAAAFDGRLPNSMSQGNSLGGIPLQHHHSYHHHQYHPVTAGHQMQQQQQQQQQQMPSQPHPAVLHQRIPSGLSSRNPSLTMDKLTHHPSNFIRQPVHHAQQAAGFQRRFTSPASSSTTSLPGVINGGNNANGAVGNQGGPNTATNLRSWHFRSPLKRPVDGYPGAPLPSNSTALSQSGSEMSMYNLAAANAAESGQHSMAAKQQQQHTSTAVRMDMDAEEHLKNQQQQQTQTQQQSPPHKKPCIGPGNSSDLLDRTLHKVQSATPASSTALGKSKAAKRAVECLKNRARAAQSSKTAAANNSAANGKSNNSNLASQWSTTKTPNDSLASSNNDFIGNYETSSLSAQAKTQQHQQNDADADVDDDECSDDSCSSTPKSGPIVISVEVPRPTAFVAAYQPQHQQHASKMPSGIPASTFSSVAAHRSVSTGQPPQYYQHPASAHNYYHHNHQQQLTYNQQHQAVIMDAVQRKLVQLHHEQQQQQQQAQLLMDLADTALSSGTERTSTSATTNDATKQNATAVSAAAEAADRKLFSEFLVDMGDE